MLGSLLKLKLKLRFISLLEQQAVICRLHNLTPIRCLCMRILIYNQGDRLAHMPEQVPIYAPGWREASEVKHFAQECKHSDPTRVRTRDQGPNA